MEDYNKDKDSYTFEELRTIVEKLRAKDGCPWDREQTHKSLKRYMIEEAYEVVDAIDTYESIGSDENLCEELGDVLLQVMLHAQIASEENRFNVDTVIKGISEKMIRRHPHVFGTQNATSQHGGFPTWDEIKKQEKEGKDMQLSELEAVPKSFPALIRSEKVLKKAQKSYGQDSDFDENIDHIISVVSGMDEKVEGKVADRIIGDLLLTVVKLASALNVNSEEALTDAIDQYINEVMDK
ncbi:MAG: YabN family protein [Lachnospiraceae bacterium]